MMKVVSLFSAKLLTFGFSPSELSYWRVVSFVFCQVFQNPGINNITSAFSARSGKDFRNTHVQSNVLNRDVAVCLSFKRY